ncbi:hypothetical protein EJ06DRAFT_471349 [Trichodelitschia bisporula]|uniref:Alpha/beta-hydrolase n=1 Tax=Trichodelitschia bisporula TaxID=703511 RepID=A0A6G1I606_9PEZI|nr:hypothetical protein EJ06DRAFT_471349 [Trichodelitschia bisporula]
MSALSSLRSGGKDGGGTNKAKQDFSGGSGPYKAQYWPGSAGSLPEHTIYAPKTPPAGGKMPLLVWANGACGSNGAGFSNFLTEIASWGVLVVANGNPKGAWGATTPNYAGSLMGGTEGDKTRASLLTEALDWAEKGAAGGKFGTIDMARVGAAGQSCGGVEAYSASVFEKRVKVIGIYNTGVIDPGRRHYLKEIKQPIGYFYGGEKDFSAKYIMQDFKDIPATLPAIMSSLQVGHMGTYFEPHGGKFGVISVAFWKWQLQGDQASKALFFNKSSTLYKDGWSIDMSHWRE